MFVSAHVIFAYSIHIVVVVRMHHSVIHIIFHRICNFCSFYFLSQTISDRTEQESTLALLSGKISEAESILLRNGSTFKAIMFNVHIHNWSRCVIQNIE